MLVQRRELGHAATEVAYRGRELGDGGPRRRQPAGGLGGDRSRTDLGGTGRARRARALLAEHRQVGLVEGRTGIDAQLVLQLPPGPVVVVEGFGLPAARLQRAHQKGVQLLVQGMLREPCGQLRDHFPVAAEHQQLRPEILQRRHPGLGQTGAQHPAHPVAGHIRQRLAPPHAQGLAQHRDGGPRLGVPGAEDQVLEPVGVHRARIGDQGVSLSTGGEFGMAGQQPAQAVHVIVDDASRAGRRIRVPGEVDHSVDRDDLIDLTDQNCGHGAQSARSQGQQSVIVHFDFNRP